MGESTQTHREETHWQTEMMGGHGLDVVCEMGIALRNSDAQNTGNREWEWELLRTCGPVVLSSRSGYAGGNGVDGRTDVLCNFCF